jgi:alkylation response protein AidB-like acyl-CoA dehydrogenase
VLYQEAKSFADRELRPFAKDWDERSSFPITTFAKMASMGYLGASISRKNAGLGLPKLESTILYEALATGCVALTVWKFLHVTMERES